MAANALKKLLQQSWNHLSPAQRNEYRNYVRAMMSGMRIAPPIIDSLACSCSLRATGSQLLGNPGPEL